MILLTRARKINYILSLKYDLEKFLTSVVTLGSITIYKIENVTDLQKFCDILYQLDH